MKLVKTKMLLTLLIWMALLLPSLAQQNNLKPTYEVYAISYGVIPDFSVANLVAGADRSRKLDIQMMVWLLKGPNGANILVDSGFYRDKLFKQWKVRDFIKPSEAIGKVGLKPEDITDVIITHMHWDHAGGMDLFSNARIWIQQDEYTYYTSEAWQPGGSHGGIDAEDVMALVKANTEGRVRLVKGDDQEAIDAIRFYTGGRHTYASQYVSVNSKAGTVLIASDNCYLYENLDKRAPIAQTLDAASNLRAQDRMKQLASNPRLIVPGHDPLVFTRFPAPGNGVARIE
ncbi:MAG TPA: N-acyl homoserine lactonase family protein [Blastocatellia bacterium]|nr:N-acyl homoserine lactonase family protein [Blastocatellia bacterium]